MKRNDRKCSPDSFQPFLLLVAPFLVLKDALLKTLIVVFYELISHHLTICQGSVLLLFGQVILNICLVRYWILGSI